MKKIFCAVAAVTVISLSVYANDGIARNKEVKKETRKEKREERKELWLHSVNSVTEAHFYNDFPDAKDVSWKEGSFAEATFRDGEIIKKAFYDSDDELVGTTSHVDFSVLPDKAKEYIEKKYPGYTVSDVILFDDNEVNDTNLFLFNSFLENEDSYFPVLTAGSKKIILNVTMNGEVSFFQNCQ